MPLIDLNFTNKPRNGLTASVDERGTRYKTMCGKSNATGCAGLEEERPRLHFEVHFFFLAEDLENFSRRLSFEESFPEFLPVHQP